MPVDSAVLITQLKDAIFSYSVRTKEKPFLGVGGNSFWASLRFSFLLIRNLKVFLVLSNIGLFLAEHHPKQLHSRLTE